MLGMTTIYPMCGTVATHRGASASPFIGKNTDETEAFS